MIESSSVVSEEGFVTLIVGQRLETFVASGVILHFKSKVRRWNRELMFDQRQRLKMTYRFVFDGSDRVRTHIFDGRLFQFERFARQNPVEQRHL